MLEVVEVDEIDREAAARALRAPDLLRDAVERHHAVGQAGERVEVRLPVQLRLLVLHLGRHGVEGAREQRELVGGLDVHGDVLAAGDVARGGDQLPHRREHVDAEHGVDRAREEQHDGHHDHRLDGELLAQLAPYRLARQADEEAAELRIVVHDREIEADQVRVAAHLLERLEDVARPGGAQAPFELRAGAVDRGADRHALGGDDHRIDDVALHRNFARVIIEQQVVVAEDRLGAHERDQASEGTPAVNELLFL